MTIAINSINFAQKRVTMQPSEYPHLIGPEWITNVYCPRHVLPHGSYLVNLAQDDKAKSKQAYTSFLDDLRRCEALGITLYNFQ